MPPFDQNNQIAEVQKPKRNIVLWSCVSILFLFSCSGLLGIGAYSFTLANELSSLRAENKKNAEKIEKLANNEPVDTQVLTESVSDISKLVSKVQPSVATVFIYGSQSSAGLFGRTNEILGSGTGFFIDSNGLFLTNEHVVCGVSASNIKIVSNSNKTYEVETVAVDSAQDIAILKINLKGDSVTPLKLANSNYKIQVGQGVIAIGNPLGDNPGSVTSGIISGLNRNIRATGSCGSSQVKEYEGVLQTDAAINSGNSGGPLINLAGEVIGINSATSSGANNISYSIPFDRVLKTVDRYKKNGNKIISPYLGVEYSMVDSVSANARNLPVGALVRNVVIGSPADKAGILKNDTIVKIGDKPIDFSLVSTLNLYFEPNQTVTVQVSRDEGGQRKIVDLTITIGQK